jgi:DNA-binding CsgD family transcriptional regulator
MNEEHFLETQDVCALASLLGDTVGVKGPNEQRAFLMRRAAELVKADCWVWGVSPLLEPGKQPVYVFHQTGGFNETRMARLLDAIEHPDTGAMTVPIIKAMLETSAQVTRARQQIIPDEQFLNSPANPFWSAANIGPLLLSIRPLPGFGISVIGFYRQLEAAPFTQRETRIAHILLTEVPWLHEAGLPHLTAASAPKLTPRCRMVLNHLIQGHTRPEIARVLGLSEQTVKGYINQVYHHFDVVDQEGLLKRFIQGDGRDR